MAEAEVEQSSIEDFGMTVLMGEIDHESVKPVIEFILRHNFVEKKKRRELVIMISSVGGCLASAFALCDVMSSSKIPIKTVGLGQVASSGLVIFMNGHQGRRVLTPNTSVLSHQFAWGNESVKAHELMAAAREVTLTEKRMVDHYRKCTGLDDDVIREKLLPANDVWLTAAEALELNICDQVATV